MHYIIQRYPYFVFATVYQQGLGGWESMLIQEVVPNKHNNPDHHRVRWGKVYQCGWNFIVIKEKVKNSLIAHGATKNHRKNQYVRAILGPFLAMQLVQ